MVHAADSAAGADVSPDTGPASISGVALAAVDPQSLSTEQSAFRGVESDRLSAAELGTVRGGFISVGGLTFDFGVTLETFIDGTLALASTLTLNSAGFSKGTTVQSPFAVPLSQIAAAAANPGRALGLAPEPALE